MKFCRSNGLYAGRNLRLAKREERLGYRGAPVVRLTAPNSGGKIPAFAPSVKTLQGSVRPEVAVSMCKVVD